MNAMETNLKPGHMRSHRRSAWRHICRLSLTVAVFGVLGYGATLQAQNDAAGRIVGKLVDAETGEPLIGANVFLEGTMIGAASDLEGNFTIPRVLRGTYTVVVSYIGYARVRVESLKVIPGQTARVDLALKPVILEGDEIVVQARALHTSDASLLRERRAAAAVSDAISAEAISRLGVGNAAQAMAMVTGATMLDDRYVYTRGLGERYSNTQLNGAELPSADPDRRAVHLDMFPAELLDNIVTTKTATPDKPGDFTGGAVNIATKSFPDGFTVSFSSTVGLNSETTGKRSFLTYHSGSTDWLGYDDGTRQIPELLKDPSVRIPDIGAAFTDKRAAELLDRISKSFSPVMAPQTRRAPANQSYGFSIGNQLNVFGRSLGAVASLNYARSLSSYTDGVSGRWQLTGKVDAVDELNNDFLLSDSQGKDDVLWGGLLSLNYKLHNNHNLGLSYLVNRSGESTARYQAGRFPRDLTGNTIYETRTLRFVERQLNSLQLRGEHYWPDLLQTRVEWNGSLISSQQDEPDLRYFTDNFTIRERNGVVDTVYAIRPSIYPVPTRYFRALDENNKNLNLDIIIPFRHWSRLQGKVKFGGALLQKERTFRERRFEFRQDKIRYSGDPHSFFRAENVGLLEEASTDQFFRFGNYVVDASQPSSNYDGTERIYAVYGMVDMPLLPRLRLIAGGRLESTRMEVTSADTSIQAGRLNHDDLLPSANLVYRLGEDMNVRLAYGRTLARPTLRELAPYASFDFVGDYIFIGNSNLDRTLIDNVDLRWERFPRPGEIVAISAFYKRFDDPIERVVNPRAAAANPEIQYRNVGRGMVYGAEFEFRQRLDRLHRAFGNIQFGANFTLVHSKVDVAADELALIRALDPDASGKRRLMGQSPYVLNFDLAYVNHRSGTSVSMNYNIFGERLTEVSIGGTPDVYEQPRGILNLSFSQELLDGLRLKIGVKNLLDGSFEKAHKFKGRTFPVQRLEAGDLVLSSNLWWGFGAGNDLAGIAPQGFVQAHLSGNGNRIVDPQLRGISRTTDGGLDPRPAAGSPALTGAAPVPDGFFVQTDYLGAFGPGDLWIDGWTFLSEAAVAKQLRANVVNVFDSDIAPGSDVLWTSENVYVLNGFVFVDEGATLTIEPGTVIKGRPGQGENASALIVARGGKIYANGTPTQPIIFTAEADDVSDPNDLPLDARGLWGGVLILGRARLNSTPGETAIEGIPTTEPRGLYGGSDDEDDSGVFRYVSIRYGGTDIGAGNEINGLTLGGVGRGTVIEFVEVFNNNDDGFEFFGGTVQTRYLVSAFNGDDAFDYDEGFRGKGQFWFAIQSDGVGNRGAEQDGGTDPEDGQPYAVPEIVNATYIGSGVGSSNADNDLALIFRDNAGGKYFNSIFTDFADRGVEVEDLASGEDSRARLEAGDLVLSSNLWWGFGAGNDLAGIAPQGFVQAHLSGNGNRIADPQLRGISRTTDGGLDPRPAAGSPALTGAAPVPDGFFVQTDYLGAFGETNWAVDWTFISHIGILSSSGGRNPLITSVEERLVSTPDQPRDFTLSQNYPNPFNPTTNITYSLAAPGRVRLSVYNLLGQEVARLVDGVRQAGTYTVTWHAADLPSGIYIYRLRAGASVSARRMTLLK